MTISKSNVAAAKGKDKQEIARVFISVNWNKSACNSIGVTAFIQLVFIPLFIAFTHGASYITSPTPLLLLQSLPYTFPKCVGILWLVSNNLNSTSRSLKYSLKNSHNLLFAKITYSAFGKAGFEYFKNLITLSARVLHADSREGKIRIPSVWISIGQNIGIASVYVSKRFLPF